MAVIGAKSLERDADEKPVPIFSHPGLARFPIGRNRPIDKNSREVNSMSVFFSPNRFPLPRDMP
jgi:hypothetical protein